MDKHNAKKIIASMMVSFSNYKPTDVDYAAKVWADMLEEYSYAQVDMGLKVYIKSDTSGFAPTPGQIIDKIQNLTMPSELNEMEAWSLVSKAIRNSGYNSVEEFAKLPPLVQKAVGLPNQLRTWALDENYNEAVVMSNFQKAYRFERQKKQELQKLPQQVQDFIEKENKNSYSAQIEQKRQEMIESANAKKQTEMKALETTLQGIPMPDEYRQRLEKMQIHA